MVKELAIDCRELTYAVDGRVLLRDVEVQLPTGARCLLIGANGAGKSTLLRILAGQKLVRNAHVLVMGKDVFSVRSPNLTYLSTDWALNKTVRAHIGVRAFLDSVGGQHFPERRDRLIRILDVNLDWQLHTISDGERRRVQLVFGLMSEWDVLLLDEVTVDLDVLVRRDLYDFLLTESQDRGATIVHATHILDGLETFATHLCHMHYGKIAEPILEMSTLSSDKQITAESNSIQPLSSLALKWLRHDRENRPELDDLNTKAQHQAGLTDARNETDRIKFFEKYDYGS